MTTVDGPSCLMCDRFLQIWEHGVMNFVEAHRQQLPACLVMGI